MIDPLSPDYSFTPVSPLRPAFGYIPADPGAEPLVTVVTPYYNTGEIFHEAARSVLMQSLQQWEWIIVNDASTDPDALSVLDTYRSMDPRICVMDLPVNSGPGAARNAAIRLARAPYIALFDSDDLLEHTALEKWAWFLESYPEYSFVKGYSIGFGALNYLWNHGFHSEKEFLEDNQIDISCMVRKSVYQKTGGYDESARLGLEDWEFWLHCASQGYWGSTIPEYLNWYRRRPNHNERWPLWDEGPHQQVYRRSLRERYANLWEQGFPHIAPREAIAFDTIPDLLPCENLLKKEKPRLLMVLPWLTTGGADKFNLDLVEQLTRRGWEITIATTVMGDHTWLPQFTRYTPDVFALADFLHLVDQPRFLRYLINSRQPDVVMVSHSEIGYMLLPYLRAYFPGVTFTDYLHLEEEYWKNGGYPRMSIEYQEQLDLSMVTSQHLKDWMVARGEESKRVEVCYINIDPQQWQPDPEKRTRVRNELGVQDDLPIILFAGRLLPQKQPNVLAKTFLKLRERGEKFLALVAGDGPDFDWLSKFVEEHKLGEQVRLLGVVSNPRIQELMCAADVFFLPSSWEGISLAIYEAMASGVAVVGAAVGGQRELLTPECGVLIDLADEGTQVERYCGVLSDLMAHPERRRSMGRAGRERVASQFPIDQMGERMASLLQEARTIHAGQPRPVPSIGLGHTAAFQAVEYTRLSRVADQLWSERNPNAAILLERNKPSWRTQLYNRLYHWHEPIYKRYSKLGFGWLTPIREMVKRVLAG
jgi:glycosyltransferase involved in cell wall biosynthesis